MFLMDNIKLDSIPNTNEIYKPVLHCISSSEGTDLALSTGVISVFQNGKQTQMAIWVNFKNLLFSYSEI